MAIDLDKITLNDILKGFDKQSKEFDIIEIDSRYRSKYPKELEKYELVNYSELGKTVAAGDVLKYTKKNSDAISCACFIKGVAYLETDSKIIDYLTLSKGTNTIWRIYPTNHYIFKLDRSYEDKKKINKIRDNLVKDGKKVRNIEVSKQTFRKILKDQNIPDNEIKRQIKINEKVDKLLNNHKIQKEKNANKKYLNMAGKNIKINQVDDIANDIFENHQKKRK